MRLALVDDWRRSWRWASVHLAWAWGAFIAFLVADPSTLQQVQQLVVYVPERWRPLATFAAFALAGLVPWLARVTKKMPADG